jgi:hypothetical protein
MPSRRLVLVAAAALAAAAGLALFGAGRGEGFDPARWRADAEGDRFAQLDALGPLLAPGLTRDAAVALLGPPDAESAGLMVWWLGVRPFRMDAEQLELRFDAEGRLTGHAVAQL